MLRSYRHALATCATLLLSAAATTAAQTNGFALQCLSATTSARGCVTRAQDDAPTSLFRDPAGLVAFDTAAFEVNVSPFMPALTFRNSANPTSVDGTRHAYPMASFAYVGNKFGRLAWALGMEPIGGFGSDFQLQHALLSGPSATPVDYESFFAAAKFGPSLAWQLAPGWSVGGSMSGVYAQITKFRMPFSMSPSIAQGLAAIPQLDPPVYGPLFQQFTELTAYGDSKSYSGMTWTADAGIAYRATNGFAFSASWSPKRAITVDGGYATIDMSAQFGQMMQAMIMARMQAYSESQATAQANVMQQLTAAGLDLAAGVVGHYDASTTLTLPQTLGAGVRIPVDSQWTLAAEVEWREWSKAENTMPFNLTNGDNANINLMLNASTTNGRFDFPFPLAWKDAWSAKGGVTYHMARGNALRGGIIYGQNPVPDNATFVAFPAISTTAATVGGSFRIGRLPLDVAYVHAFAHEAVGPSQGHLIASEYNQSRTTMSQDVIIIGATWKY